MTDSRLPRMEKLNNFELVGEVKLGKNASKPNKVYKVKCPYCKEIISNKFIARHLKQSHNKTLITALKEYNNILKETDKCYMCDNPRDVELRDKLNPRLRPSCTNCSLSYGKLLQTETLVNTIDETSGKSLMKLRMEKQFSTMKNTIDPATGKDNFELYLEKVERSTRTQATRYKSTDLYYRSKNELDFYEKYYEKLGLTKAPTIKNYYKNHYYFPDAFIPSTKTVVEIKSMGVMKVRQSPYEVYLKLSKTIELGYKVLFVLDFNEFHFKDQSELDKYFDKYLK